MTNPIEIPPPPEGFEPMLVAPQLPPHEHKDVEVTVERFEIEMICQGPLTLLHVTRKPIA